MIVFTKKRNTQNNVSLPGKALPPTVEALAALGKFLIRCVVCSVVELARKIPGRYAISQVPD